MQLNTVRYLAIAACLILLVSCERPTAISVKVAPGPSFELGGSGELADFTVFAPSSDLKIANPFEEKDAVWRIDSSNRGSGTRALRLEYGRVPNAYTQSVPVSPKAAPPLLPGMIYAFWARSTNAGESTGYFAVGKQGVVRVGMQDLCFASVNNHQVETKCGTHEPYPQPTDVDEFTRQHQIPQ